MKKVFLYVSVTLCFSGGSLLADKLENKAPFLENAARGKEVYTTYCIACHGAQMEGGIGPSLNDDFWAHGSSPEAILRVITDGIDGSEMLSFKEAIPEADRVAMRDFILSEQAGMRELRKGVYPREFFKGKSLTPELFDSVESLSQMAIPENLYYFGGKVGGVIRGNSKLYIKEPGEHRFLIDPYGRTTIYLDGEKIYDADVNSDADTLRKTVDLQIGVYDLEILHEEKPGNHYRFNGSLVKVEGEDIPLMGESLMKKLRKVIKANGKAQVVRKMIEDIPPRSLLCLLPNEVIVAINPTTGEFVKAWHSAYIDQSPSLPDRSKKPSKVVGKKVDAPSKKLIDSESLQFSSYATEGDEITISFLADGSTKKIIIRPEGEDHFRIDAR